MKGLIAKKIGMTQIYTEDGRRIPVTVLQAGPNIVIQKKSALGKDGYTAVKLGFDQVHTYTKEGEEPRFRATKAMVGVFQKAGIEVPSKYISEFRLNDETALDDYTVGESFGPEVFTVGQFVDISGTSKGRGFSGVMKRHNFKGMRASHGTHEYFRHGGSIGASADPARVFKGMKMPGQHGNCRTTVQNAHVVDIIAEDNLLLVKGGVPGPKNGIVFIKTAVKKPRHNKAV